MRVIRRFLPVLLLVPLGAVPVQAQSWWGVTYAPSIPLSNTKDFADNASWRGINLEYKKAVKENVTAGLSFGWHVFDEQTDEVLSSFGVDISGDQFRYINSFPLLANVSYFLGKPGGVRPFIGADVGVYVMEHRLDIGLYTIHETNAHFGFGPEAGIRLSDQAEHVAAPDGALQLRVERRQRGPPSSTSTSVSASPGTKGFRPSHRLTHCGPRPVAGRGPKCVRAGAVSRAERSCPGGWWWATRRRRSGGRPCDTPDRCGPVPARPSPCPAERCPPSAPMPPPGMICPVGLS